MIKLTLSDSVEPASLNSFLGHHIKLGTFNDHFDKVLNYEDQDEKFQKELLYYIGTRYLYELEDVYDKGRPSMLVDQEISTVLLERYTSACYLFYLQQIGYLIVADELKLYNTYNEMIAKCEYTLIYFISHRFIDRHKLNIPNILDFLCVKNT
jgi:hypothetical protein